ncbi:hypothetical protein [Campylobacter sp. RM16192]|uniref:hypothetical protein n=1 Tax=Campylobacter sp. RM16192 TaxID=1660080 RepID=UPI0014528181|nr:hypothetical protein [Campylobacter sp. RM16192]QCD51967.1 hypothetical protein CDOMC_0307 [Campylobacter sp. RM16192]
MNANEILKAVGKDLSDTEQKFLKLLATYQNDKQEGKGVTFDVMDCAFDLFVMLENLAGNYKALKARYEDLQRAVRLYCLGKLSKEELLAEMVTANVEIKDKK